MTIFISYPRINPRIPYQPENLVSARGPNLYVYITRISYSDVILHDFALSLSVFVTCPLDFHFIALHRRQHNVLLPVKMSMSNSIRNRS